MFRLISSNTILRLKNSRKPCAQLLRRPLIAPPKPDGKPLLARRADRELPDIPNPYKRWIQTFPIFVAVMIASALAIFNYQKASSPIVSAALYALRTSSQARDLLGDEIYFRDKLPWISGEMNQLHGRIDIGFWVKGSKSTGYMRFKSTRKTRMAYFKTEDWSLETEEGTVIQLLQDEEADPFKNTALRAEQATT